MASNEQSESEEIIRTLIKLIPADYLIKEGIPAVIQGDQILMRPVFGLQLFLSSWLNDQQENPFLITEISKFLEKFNDYIDYSRKILKFMHDKGRVPEKDEAWDLDIPIDEMDLVLDLINIKITGAAYSRMTLSEKKYYDDLSKNLILIDEKIEEFRLEDLSTQYSFNLIDAKIIPLFINDLLSLEDINKEVAKYLNLSELSDKELDNLSKLATKFIKSKLSEKKELNLLDLAKELDASIMKTGEALYFLSNSEKIVKREFSGEEINHHSKILSKALKHCRNQKEELNVSLLIHNFNTDLMTANEIITLYGKKFELPEQLSREEIKNLDQISHSVIKYIKEVNESPTIDDLMIDLNLNIRSASIIFSFINKISSEPFQEDFETYPEKVLSEIDDLSCKLLKLEKDQQKELDLIELTYQLNTGIYSIKRALFYITWIEKRLDTTYIQKLSLQERKIIEGKVIAALKYIKEKNLELDFKILIEEVGFNLKDTHLIIGLYNQIISKEINVEIFAEDQKRNIEILSRKIYKAKKDGEISNYEPEEVFTLDMGKISLEDLWQALVYLKVKVLNILMEKSKIVKTELGKISAEGAVQLKERYGTKVGTKEEIQLSKETIKLQDTTVKFKTAAERVELKRGMDFVGGLIRYKVAIKNNTEMLINNLEVSLQMTAEHIRTIDIKPRVYKKGDRAKIPSMSPRQSESIDFYLEPMICGSIPVSPITTYIDAFGKPQMATRESLMVISKCPPIINPGEENIAKVRNIYESNDIIRSFRSFELEHDPNRTFDLLREAIGAWAGKSVSQPVFDSREPFIAEIYYYVLNQNKDPSLGHQEQIIVKIQLDEEKNVAMLHIGAEKNPTVNGVLTHIWQLANERFGEAFGYIFEALHCPECGGSFDNMDKSKETIKCRFCGEIFEKKALRY